ncbi:peptide-methionine (S)-S-oxide reductase MsrA [Erythrobacter sp. SCSIO 43205]|uniref:peptide-methionine (S)-S-oxide reductase MsrA n=1 Tax=Erythrobacter sp. SCSIO 43205 TaxID=2779361 RepID=UPI001CA7FC74|nr:peptide-methionine (S)-S-oxide reductase MsrA [Erythrobacter sp. SCSIO 43205]UAB78536.1 peptide-methionine (S)-S-oxide reductase MsrA [Erythrobacter sp. SCSIO 43205]
MKRLGLWAAAALAAGGVYVAVPNSPAHALEEPVNAPAAKRIAREGAGLKTAIFAGGCFWGVEGVFSHVKGVKSAVAGYHGGSAATAKYSRIVQGGTAHAEAVKITYDPYVVRYDELLRIFFSVVADPTLKNRQGPDVGAHYRSALVPTSDEQRAVAEAYLAQMEASNVWSRPIVTKIESQRTFYRAEGYHQDFMAKNPNHRYIVRWDKPKVQALKVMFPRDFKAEFLRDN